MKLERLKSRVGYYLTYAVMVLTVFAAKTYSIYADNEFVGGGDGMFDVARTTGQTFFNDVRSIVTIAAGIGFIICILLVLLGGPRVREGAIQKIVWILAGVFLAASVGAILSFVAGFAPPGGATLPTL